MADQVPGDGHDGGLDAGLETQSLLQAIARAADVCLKPYRHAVRVQGEAPGSSPDRCDCSVLIEARSSDGMRCPERDLELEMYRSGDDLNLMLTPRTPDGPLLWHGSHPVWMEPNSGERCASPVDGAPLEALCRRLRALLVPGESAPGGR